MFKKQPLTKCWTCQNAVPNEDRGCSWSRYGEPVEGWTAEANELISNGEHKDTFLVLDCPCYIKDKPRKRVRTNEDGKFSWRAVII